MPIPSPKGNEDRDTFMSRCMSFVTKENDSKPDGEKRDRKQLVAICFSKWKDKNSDSSTEAEISESSDKFIEEFLERHPEYKQHFKV